MRSDEPHSKVRQVMKAATLCTLLLSRLELGMTGKGILLVVGGQVRWEEGQVVGRKTSKYCHGKKTKIPDRVTKSRPDEVEDNVKPFQGTPKWPQEQGSLRPAQVT